MVSNNNYLNNKIEPTKLEKELMNALLEGNDRIRKTLRFQWENSSISSRELSGAGFFLHFNIPENIPKIKGKQNIEISRNKKGLSIAANIPEVKHGTGFILFVRDGKIDWLEGFTYADPWPENVSDFKLEYIKIPKINNSQVFFDKTIRLIGLIKSIFSPLIKEIGNGLIVGFVASILLLTIFLIYIFKN